MLGLEIFHKPIMHLHRFANAGISQSGDTQVDKIPICIHPPEIFRLTTCVLCYYKTAGNIYNRPAAQYNHGIFSEQVPRSTDAVIEIFLRLRVYYKRRHYNNEEYLFHTSNYVHDFDLVYVVRN